MRRGDIVFIRGHSPIAPLIRWADGEFTHVGIVLDESHMLDARWLGGVKPRHFDFKQIDCEFVPAKGDLERAMRFIGYHYDVLQFLWYAVRWRKPWNSPNQLICSELIAHYLGRMELISLTPNELYRELVS